MNLQAKISLKTKRTFINFLLNLFPNFAAT
jgi:hypothetical protein